LNSKFFLTR